MNSPLEKAIVVAVLRFLNRLPGCVARKRWGTGMGIAGDPDISGCIYGRHFEFEVKRPGEIPSPLQCKRMEEWRGAGAVVAVVTSVEETREVLQSNGAI
jgi:hypothetical protein